MESPFPRIHIDLNVTTNPTKMNVIIPVIPQPIRNLMDLIFLVIGVNLNIFVVLVIALNSCMYTTTNCYIVSLVFANLAILLEPLQETLYWLLEINFEMNIDYIFMVTFDTNILTIILLNIEAYVVVCQKDSPICRSLLKTSTAIKSVLFIWAMCIVVTAMELHTYDHFEKEIMYDIYVSSTIMFLFFPCFIFVMLDCFILYELIILKSIEGTWPSKDLERFLFLIRITGGFLLIMVPYRIMKVISFMASIRFCCSNVTTEVLYTIIKIYPMILPLTCFVASKEFRGTFKLTFCCQRRTTSI